jgi:hypothetical protein
MEERGPSAPGAIMLITLAVVVLLVACANVAGLLIAVPPVARKSWPSGWRLAAVAFA